MNRIQQLLKEFRISASELSRICEIPYRTTRQWETGDRQPPEYVVKLIAYKLIRKILDARDE